jgi:predicted ArsR family transcriptional regulator
MPTRTDVRRAFGRRPFTAGQLAEEAGCSVATARVTIQRLVEAGDLVRTDDVLQYVSDEGRALRGRPQHLYRLR